MKSGKPGRGDATSAVHGGEGVQRRMVTNPKVAPIFETSVFTYETLDEIDDFLGGNPDNYNYTRLGNPNQRALEEWILALETAGLAVGSGDSPSTAATWGALSAGSGTAAIAAAIGSACDAGSTVAVSRDIYGGTQTLVEREFSRWGVKPAFVDTGKIASGAAPFPAGAKLLVLEAASNPLIRIADIDKLSDRAHAAGARILVDNSFLSPVLFKPLEHGADAVVHSTTKYINGHSDATGGLLVAPADWAAAARRVVQNLGAHLAPFEAWLTLRGARTLALRMKAHSENALTVARWLVARKDVQRVWYPGLENHPEHDLAKRLFPRGMGGIMSFDLAGGLEAVDAFMRAVRIISFAPSLAGVSTTISHPAKTSHRAHSPESLAALQIKPGTVRLSVGIEDLDDILEDLARGLEAAAKV